MVLVANEEMKLVVNDKAIETIVFMMDSKSAYNPYCSCEQRYCRLSEYLPCFGLREKPYYPFYLRLGCR